MYLSSLTETQCKDGVHSFFQPLLYKLQPIDDKVSMRNIKLKSGIRRHKQKNFKWCIHRQRVLYFQQHMKCSLAHKLSSYKHVVIPNTDVINFITGR